MGRLATYIAIDEPRLDALWWQKDAAFRKSFLELENDATLARLELDKIWDALHCTLTGKSAATPVEGNKLSEAVVGVQPKIFDDDDYSIFVSVIENDELQGILDELDRINKAKLESLLDPACLERENVYPQGIWNDPRDRLVDEMATDVESMRQFFRGALESGKHVLATIL